MSGDRYREAGVDPERGQRTVEAVRAAVASTHGSEVLGARGGFAGVFDLAAARELDRPALVASTDGIGTKPLLAARLGRFEGLGHDLVNHGVDDVLAHGGRPLFVLDHLAATPLDPARHAAVVEGAAAACRAAGCALLGGDTAEMPGLHRDGALDLVGTVVGLADREAIVDGRDVTPGDAVLGLPSSGPHTNGYSLVRRLVADADLEATPEGFDAPLGETLLRPHRSYLGPLTRLWDAGVPTKALVHVTGGGLVDNPPRVLPEDAAMALHEGSWPVPPVFEWLQRRGAVSTAEMRRVFNMGLGMLVVVDATDAGRARELLAATGALDRVHTVGEIVRRADAPVRFVGS